MNRTKFATIAGSLAVTAIAMAMLLVCIGSLNTALASEPVRQPAAPLAPGDVVINEFVAKGSEWVELYNTTGSAIDIGNWTVTSTVSSLDHTVPDGTIIAAAGYYTLACSSKLNNSGDAIWLMDDATVVDQVAFGRNGPAPLPSGDYSAARAPNGNDTDDDAADWNLTISPTMGVANIVPGVSLGTSLIFNEFDNYPSSGNDKVEIYNPTAETITLTNWLLSDGDAVALITGTVTVPPGGWTVLEESVDWTVSMDFSSADVGYLFQPDGTRVDQIGWDGEFEDGTYQRNPDGDGPNDGYDWTSSGGDVTWFDLPETLGYSNNRSLSISKDGPPAVMQGDVVSFSITVNNMSSVVVQDVIITESLPTGVDYGGFVTHTIDLALTGATPPVWDAGTVVSNSGDLAFTVWVTFTGPFTDRQIVDNVVWMDSSTAGFDLISSTLSTIVLTETTSIHDIQGSGSASPMDGDGVIIEGVVVGDFQDTGNQLGGFFVQEQDADADNDPLTSEGIFVYDSGFGVDVNVGDIVYVVGEANEYYGLTRLRNVDSVEISASGASVTPASVTLPLASADGYERYENMLLVFPQELTVAEVYNLGRYGQASLSQGGRLFIPTNVVTPGVAANALQDANDLRRLLLDDGSNVQNPDPIIHPSPELNATNTLRTGDAVTALTGVLDYAYGDYRLQPTTTPVFVHANARPAAPAAVGGTVHVASFNVLNYFTTIDTGAEICGPSGDMGCRGADSESEFTRQRAKIIDAIVTMDADVVGLMEIENNAITATQDLVDGLNAVAGAGAYDYIDTGTIGTDAIKVALIYQPGTVTPVGPFAVLDSSFDPAFIDTKSRPVLAQTFEENATGGRFTAAVNHLKSKGSDCDALGDPDTGDGQANCNLTRTSAMTVELAWLATDPTGSGDPDFIIIGDLNSYAREDPIVAAEAAGYTDLLRQFVGAGAYSYVFGGQAGHLDYAMSNASLTSQVVSATAWHINADEPRVLDYDENYKSAGHIASLYDDGPYRASDHDPVIVGLDLIDQTALTITKSVMPTEDVSLGDTVVYTITIANDGVADAFGVVITDALPSWITFGGYVNPAGTAQLPSNGVITWEYPVASGASYNFVFTATVTAGTLHYGVTNVAYYTSDNGGSGFDAATFTTKETTSIYLPFVARSD